ncbi:MAG: hypothetical protein ABIH04_01070 [Planctomycetota bacterium]
MAHKEKDLQWLLQKDVQDLIQSRLDQEPWITVYSSINSENENGGVHCALIPESRVKEVLTYDSWDLKPYEGMPYYEKYQEDGTKVFYLRFGDKSDEGIEPLVFCRSFYGIKPSSVEISEEFRHFHNLYHDHKTNKYIRIREDGEEEEIIKFEDNSVKMKVLQLKQFLTIKDMRLAVYFDFVRNSCRSLEELGITEVEDRFNDNKTCYSLTVRKDDFSVEKDCKTYSRLFGKRLLAGIDKEKLAIWPYDKPANLYIDFVIGVTKNGENISYTCNPSQLNNLFGSKPGAPNYFTPVFFRPDVLQKYYAYPEKYTVGDGKLYCGDLWGLRMDNNRKDFVIVFLGDLGRDLAYNEQIYWKNFNVPPEGGISEVARTRGFKAKPADPEKADLLFKHVFGQFQSNWLNKFDWPLFKWLKSGDSYIYNSLRVPLVDSQKEFDEQVLALAKILVESLNVKKLQEALPKKVKHEKSITKLERFLISQGLDDCMPYIKFLRNLYDLRHGAGHIKGETYEKAAAFFHLTEKYRKTVFENVLRKAIEFLTYLQEHLL